ncbi:Selenocysteine lyase/Cysteine desulfurase CsdA [Methanonatronarchaeum thermophilum]|uniref:cysteine desulfurase n=1 Tax=Methanonatronarchaeum thermophilum TaxID=1927129 RepID=A0A1Y3GEY4_9EURY|nr:cysteine desulfurase [Methanonatronarchaeum thermophilum]OUJ18754.1 Selenocysteine lyase/Cysteine desulfurase CsdA [Methanonatronarchaeum thermophilum]
MNINVRDKFPLTERVVYLDNAATSLTPTPVLQEMNGYYNEYCANVDRGVHHLSKLASHRYKDAHKKIGEFIGCNENEVVLTKNTTEAINQVACGLDWSKGDHVITTVMEHHSNFVPWLRLKEKGVEVDIVGIKNGAVDINEVREKIKSKTRLIAVCHASNVLGTINPIEEIGEICRENDIYYLVDGAQSTPHIPIDVAKYNCDFFCFSGHKMLGPTGIGVLYCKQQHLDKIKPLLVGGGNVSNVTEKTFDLKKGHKGIESGTPHIAGAIGLTKAIEILNKIGLKKIQKHEQKLNKILIEELAEINSIDILYPDIDRTGVISFNIEGQDPHQTAIHLDQKNIIVRSGNHCSQPLVEHHNYNKILRTSNYLYNTEQEIKKLTQTIKKTI